MTTEDVTMAEESTAPAATATTSGISPQHFDLESYINKYTGHTKIARLIFIAEKSEALRNDAYKLALDEIKQTSNTCDGCLARAPCSDLPFCPRTNFAPPPETPPPPLRSPLYLDVVANAIPADASM
jgi:hypothetical protein